MSIYMQGIFVLGIGWWLLRQRPPARWHQPALFGAIFAYFLLFYGSALSVFSMAGDNICQIAYWKILFHPNLTGSIGASYTKPGQLLLLGTLFEASTIFGETAFRIGLCLIMACCVWCLMRIATDIGGKEAGMLAFLVATLAFRTEFLAGSFSIFLIPTLFTGFWLYYQQTRFKSLGRILLVASIHFHILVIPVLGVIWLLLLKKREWRELGSFTLSVMGSLTVWLLLILRVQGSLERLSSSGPAVGYIGSFGDTFTFSSKGEYLYKAVWAELSGSYSIAVLFILIAIGMFGAWRYGYTHYVSITSVVLLLVVNVLLLDGTINLNRYFAIFYAFGCSVGIGSMVRFAKEHASIEGTTILSRLLTGLTLLLAITVFTTLSAGHRPPRTTPPFVDSAKNLLTDQRLPQSTRLMTEDDLLYPLVILTPARFPTLTALQRFNTATIPQRTAILEHTDYIWIVRTGAHQYYYLNYLVEPNWHTDPFRLMIHRIILTNMSQSLYGYRFVPVDNNQERLILRVSPDRPS